jgi:hypothetical protein
MLDEGVCATTEELANRERVNRGYMSRVLRLTLLVPEIVEAILDGRQPEGVRLEDLLAGVPVGQDFVASGFLVFAIGQGLIVSGAAMELAASTPSFGAGCGLWAVGLALISVPQAFPLAIRILGLVAAAMLAVTALQIFSGAPILPTSSPLPFFAYPFLVATLFGWIWALLIPRIG